MSAVVKKKTMSDSPDQPALGELEVTGRVERCLHELAESLQIPDSRYESANRAYKSVGEWLQRPESSLIDAFPVVSLQGSFRHGLAIKPVNDEDDHDVDLVCQVTESKTTTTQRQLKHSLGVEMKAYAGRHSMQPPDEGKRCWTLHYAESARFHLDLSARYPG